MELSEKNSAALLDGARQRLQDALLAGEDATAARAELAAHQQRIAAEVTAARDAVAAKAHTDREAAREADAQAAESAQGDFAAVVGIVEAASDAEPLPAPSVPGVVLQAVQQVQRAQRALAAAQAPYAAAAKDVAAVRARLNAKETARAEIRARRAGGNEQPGDAAEMAALAMDAEDLRHIVSGLQSGVDAVAPVLQAAQQAVLDAQRDLATAKSRAELDAMVERVRAVEGHFVQQVRALRLAAQARGHANFGSVFLPSEKLRMLAAGGWI